MSSYTETDIAARNRRRDGRGPPVRVPSAASVNRIAKTDGFHYAARLERFPIELNNSIGKRSLYKKLERVLIEKVYQLFRKTLWPPQSLLKCRALCGPRSPHERRGPTRWLAFGSQLRQEGSQQRN